MSSPPPSSPLFPIAETGYLQMFGFWGVFPVSVCFNNTGDLIIYICIGLIVSNRCKKDSSISGKQTQKRGAID